MLKGTMHETYMTLGVDKHGQVYGIGLNPNGSFHLNPLGYSTSCVVIRPVTHDIYTYVTEDPESAKELWQGAVAADKTELGLKEWFDEYRSEGELWDMSFVDELLNCNDNPTIAKWNRTHKSEVFKSHVERLILKSSKCPQQESEDDICIWEAAGLFAPERPFAIELAPREVLDRYYAHLGFANARKRRKR